jgi:hypothetical protein
MLGLMFKDSKIDIWFHLLQQPGIVYAVFYTPCGLSSFLSMDDIRC